MKLAEKIQQIIELLYKEIFAEMVVEWEIILEVLAENEINIKKVARIEFEFLKCRHYPEKCVNIKI